MYAVTGATGNTGNAVANLLLDAGQEVRALVRSKDKAVALGQRGAQIVALDLGDPMAIARAFDGVRGAYLLSPPDPRSDDFLRDREQLVASYARAARAAGVEHVVFLSSIGAHEAHGTGIIRSAYNAEQLLRDSGVPSTLLRAGYFAENWASVLPAAKQDGVLPSFIAPDQSVPTVAAPDIARAATDALLAGLSAAIRVVELAGPADVTPREVAGVLTELLARPVEVQHLPVTAAAEAFQSFGFSANVAALYRDLYAGLATGKVAWQRDGAEFVRGRTQLKDSLRALLG